MFLLHVELEANPAFSAELETVLRSLVDVSEREAGTIYYAVHRPQERRNSFILYELYKDRAAWDRHLQSGPVQEALKHFETMLVAPPKITVCETVAATRFG